MSGIKKSFGATQALGGVNLDIYANEIHAIVGSNGAGKSTLMKMLAGLYKPDEGTIVFKNEDITGLSPLETQRKGIQVVHQVLNIVPSLSVFENILLAMPPVKTGFLNWKSGIKKAEETLGLIGFPLDLKANAGRLSVSEQQFIILARAIVNETKILVLDEPTARLSLEETNRLFDI
ncbi:MAG: ATP-binding cassette domain-containing protein, partial [Treponema sp.]|nr:ATP-binding cassette domain-containing protein [Treponema sp.]